jgi:hypothetical protein
MKRAFVFVVAGPIAVALMAAFVLGHAGAPGPIAQYIAGTLFLLTVPVMGFAGAVDGGLARRLPLALRVPLTAIAGAAGGGAIAFGLLHCFFPPSELMCFPLGGAMCAAICSLLANDYSDHEQASVPAGA